VGSSLIKGRWKVLKKIGAGAFGEIYSGKNIITNELVAIKVERVDSKKQVLKLEVAVLKKLQACPYVCRFITCGRFNEYNYMIMELLGENLSELRRRQPDGKFSMTTTLKLGMQMLKALEAVHDLGYIHRDVKPSNFAMGLTGVKRHVTFLIDFGLARRYLLSSGEVRPPRDSTGFRGTARYASINSHLSKDLGRRDDIWSIFYILIESVQGQLPWRKLKDKDQIGEMKIKWNTPELVKDLPPQFLAFMKHMKSLNYADRPDYNYLQSLMQDLYHSAGGDEHTPFDWELGPSSSSSTASSNAAAPRYTPSMSVPMVGVGMVQPHLSTMQEGDTSRPLAADHSTTPSTPHSPHTPHHPQHGQQAPGTGHAGDPPQPNHVSRSVGTGPQDSDDPDRANLEIRERKSSPSNSPSAASVDEQTGSWNQKSSPRGNNKGSTSDVHIKTVGDGTNNNKNSSNNINNNNKQGANGHSQEASANTQQRPQNINGHSHRSSSRHSKNNSNNKAGCKHCIIM
jgi:tau tubulin kinase